MKTAYLFQVVCQKCSSQKAPLAYDDNKLNRVCDKCAEVLLQRESDSEANMEESLTPSKVLHDWRSNKPSQRGGVLNVSYTHDITIVYFINDE